MKQLIFLVMIHSFTLSSLFAQDTIDKDNIAEMEKFLHKNKNKINNLKGNAQYLACYRNCMATMCTDSDYCPYVCFFYALSCIKEKDSDLKIKKKN